MTRFRALPVELGVIYLLPRPEIQFPFRYRHDHFVVYQQAFKWESPLVSPVR